MTAGSMVPITRDRRGGFSLIEACIVLALLGIGSMIVLPNMIYVAQKKRQNQSVDQVETVRQAIERYWLTHGNTLPDTLQQMNGVVMLGIPKDGWMRPLQYQRISDIEYELWSLGSDGQTGYHGAGQTTCFEDDIVVDSGDWRRFPASTTQRICG